MIVSHGLLLLPLLLFFLSLSGADGSGHGNISTPICPVGDCGDGVKIPYPFWLSNGSSASFCGFPELKISCKGSNSSFRTSTGNYTVKSIDTQKQILSLIDTELMGNHSCPRARRNVSLDGSSTLKFSSSNRYLDFFFNCDLNQLKGLDNILSRHVVSCLRNVSGTSLVFYREQLAKYGSGLSSACDNETVESPVLAGPLLDDGNLLASFGAAMNGGFELTWKDLDEQDCWSCEDSGGYCGYSNKTGGGLEFQCFCKDGIHYKSDCRASGFGAITAVIATFALFLAIFCVIEACWHWRWGNSRGSNQNVEAFLTSDGLLAVRRYTSSDVRRMTASYNNKLGEGGYGTVYKGALPDGTLVAVKLLNDTKETGEEFINEVASIGRTNHVNVVSLLGFCSERASRALIYEFMPNGSLEKYLFAADPSTTAAVAPLKWGQLHDIAVGIAKGLEYLHRGCNTRMVHFDIKPHNILLDKDFCPKISDFGLAKLHNDKNSYLSSVLPRGTIGYIAPEVFSRNFGVVSGKSDVYSYGMMVLEMVGGRRRRKANARVQETSESYFPRWIYEHLDEEGCGLRECGVAVGSEEIARKMVLVGLWCIQTNPSSRPPISKVVEMLEGSVDHLEMPPKPYLSSPESSEIDSLPSFSSYSKLHEPRT